MTTEWIEAGGVVHRYALSGAGSPTVVLLHEMGGAIESWRGVVRHLPAGWRVLAYDLRGSGMSEKIVGEIGLDDFTGDLAALLEALEIDGPVCLAASALGAAVAIHFAATRPERTRALVAFSPACGLPPERRAAARELADLTARVGVRAARSGNATAAQSPRPAGTSYATLSSGNDGRSQAAWRRMLADLEMDDDFARIACPSLFVGGLRDPVRPPAATRALADKVPGCRYLELDTGHFAAWDTPEQTAEVIVDFFGAL